MKKIFFLFLGTIFLSAQLWSESAKNNKWKFDRDVLPLFENYCYRCHGDGVNKGNVSLDFDLAGKGLSKDFGLWKRVWENVYRHNMPPADKPQFSDGELNIILDWIEEDIFKTDPRLEDPGRVTIRRLNRSEYKNTIRDLFGIYVNTENFFPPDDTGYGFDTIGEVLSMSPILMEKYMQMAENILTKAFGPPENMRELEQKFQDNRMKLLHGIDEKDFNDESVERTLETMLSKIFRRTISGNELRRHMNFFIRMKAQENSSFLALRLVLKAALVSPHFLFREEYQPNSNDKESIHQLDAFALASRLSYFLWSSTPDDRLLKMAQEKTLLQNLEREALRMIQDEKADGFVQNFTGQWLQIRDLDLMDPDLNRFPDFSAELKESMRQETESFFAYILRKNRSVFEFVKSNYTFVDKSMAKFYGLNGRFGNNFQKVIFPKNQTLNRGGFLTQASILTITSNATRTSPVKRGRWVLDNILGAPPKDPPPGIAELEDFENHNSDNFSLREQMAIHSKNTTCSSCHANMDAMGYTMENFDPIGKWRNLDDGKQVDANGQLGSGEKFNGVEDLKTFIVQKKPDAFLNCLAEKLLIYAIGRGIEYFDRKGIKHIVKQTKLDGNGFADLVINVIKSKPFLLRRGG